MSVPTMMCVAHAGGQGKTTLAQLLYLAKKADGVSPELAAADFLDARGASKLGKLYPNNVEEFGIGAALTLARGSANSKRGSRSEETCWKIFLGMGALELGLVRSEPGWATGSRELYAEQGRWW